ncbi:GMC family oxidoreductase N-terminal domain-containing protein [Bradyrhizobium sp. LMTR 3]|uniref:GMC family oxidoreductase n=1 Tax=Bradyrhizobium sp. LMTR 3 TaxID=189873 RepID=UPI000810A93F|nr:GMC family oxidoreductase N-terminal domain-containing protein [Bradyrhizobium sp. LMTR 3]OCK59895.1 alanine-phosphoribitol ligase [Bradyrhizobium sp. LMTR 3]
MHDIIIVGGGSAGSALAARLSEDPDSRVLLLEAGPRDWNPYIHMPVGFYKTTKGSLTWRYQLAPQVHQDGITPLYPQARVLGGGSSINAQVYIRGNAEDFNNWVDMGCTGWGYKDVLPYFRRSERNEKFSSPYHGTEGPLSVVDQLHPHKLSKAFVQACQEYGVPFNPDFNGAAQAGTGLYQTTNYEGRRCSAAVAYLRSAMKRKNLTVRTSVMVSRILIEKGRAVGVEILDNGRTTIQRASREIVVTAGAIGSPKLLMLSGIGPSAHLQSHGIRTLVDLPGVGQNLHDHLDVFMMYNVKDVESYDAYKKTTRKIMPGIQYILFRNGPVAATIVEGGAFCWTDKTLEAPDLQYHFLPGTGVEEVNDTAETVTGNGCTLNGYFMHPRARGAVTLKSADPRVAPSIDPNFLGDPYDVERTIDCVKVGQEIMSQPAMARYIVNEFMPGSKVRTRAEYLAFVRKIARSGYHPVGTCKMGQDDMAVVDPQLRVRGVDGLRVADSSIMPRLVSGNTNAPSIMIGERASDFISGNRPPVSQPKFV